MSVHFRTFEEAYNAFQADRVLAEERGITFDGAVSYIPDSWRRDYRRALEEGANFAFDAQSPLTTDPNAGIPWQLTNLIDPKVYEILFAPVKMAEIIGEEKKGTWLDKTAMFPVVEHTGDVQTYGDDSEGGSANVNLNWPQRQAYKFQTVIRYGQEELETAGLARIDYVSELGKAAASALNRYLNLTYAYGVNGLQNYGLLNDPNLPASISPTTKANYVNSSSNAWYVPGSTALNASPNEIFDDFQANFTNLVIQSAGLVNRDTTMIAAMSPQSEAAMLATNIYNVNVSDLLKKNFPNLTIKTAVQYGVKSTANPEGIAAGNLFQLIAPEIEGQKAGYCAYNEKLKSFPIVRGLSNFKQKQMSGTWGAVLRQTIGISQMLGI